MNFVSQQRPSAPKAEKMPQGAPMQVACSSWASVPSEFERTMVKIFGDTIVSMWFSMMRKERCWVPEFPPIEAPPPKAPSFRQRAKAFFTKPSHLSTVLAHDSAYLVLEGSKKDKTPSIVVRQPTEHGISDELQLALAEIEGPWTNGIPLQKKMKVKYPREDFEHLLVHRLNPTYGYPVRTTIEETPGHTSLWGIPKEAPKVEGANGEVVHQAWRNLVDMGIVHRLLVMRAIEAEKEWQRAQLAEAQEAEAKIAEEETETDAKVTKKALPAVA
ncbi:hypothetical protein ONZ45_g15308 [Pleurotus djamor]|nr:hypothetical protein ONZ45_g15308 [Pleurotus djamor]